MVCILFVRIRVKACTIVWESSKIIQVTVLSKREFKTFIVCKISMETKAI